MRTFIVTALLVVVIPKLGWADEPKTPNIPQIVQDGIDCNPQDVDRNTVLKVKLPSVHGGDLAIVNPKGEYFLIAFNQPDKTLHVDPPMQAAAFKMLRNIDIPIASAVGISFSKLTWTAEPIFVKSGRYRLLVSPQLQTEDPEIDGWCFVDLK